MTALARPNYTVSYVSQIESGRRNPSARGDGVLRRAARRHARATWPRGSPTGPRTSCATRWRTRGRPSAQGELEHAELGLVEVLERATDFDAPTRLRGEALVLRGDVLAARGDLRDAIDAYEEALEHGIAQRHAGMAISGLARAYRSMGDLTYSVELVEKFLAGGDRAARPRRVGRAAVGPGLALLRAGRHRAGHRGLRSGRWSRPSRASHPRSAPTPTGTPAGSRPRRSSGTRRWSSRRGRGC